ncbi:hypothetical protein [Micromonospora sp. CPCC 206061]|uniref:hypothetical protein n=1 Tax=Micromonospora sp. CPCC 206061 TaxID=3122410 RepID=UPI002FF2202D
MDYRDWGYDTRGPRDRRASDDARPSERGSTGEVERFRSRRAGAHRAEGDPEAEPPRIGYATLSEFRSAYRGRRRQEDTPPATDRPYGRRSARERWEEPADESRDLRPGVNTAEWTREAYTGEWSRSDYADQPTYTDRSDFTGQWSTSEASTEQWAAPTSYDDGAARPSRSERRGVSRRERRTEEPGAGRGESTRAGRWDTGRRSYDPPASSIPASAMPSSSMPSSSIPSSSIPASGLPGRYDVPSRYADRDRDEDEYDRPSWGGGRDRSPTGRRRRSWQDQIEPRWDTDEAETEAGSDDIEPRWGGSGGSGREKFETRWTAGELDDETSVRLSRDDPRWVGIPSSAPRSPAVAYPDEMRSRVPAPRSAPPLDRGSALRQRAAAPAFSRRASLVEVADDDELLDEAPRGTTAGAILATLAWYAVPLVIFVVYTFTIGSADRAQAFNSLVGATGRFGAALALSVVVAVFIRWLSATWRSVSVGLAAAVVGGGLSTVVLSVISGQPLG